MRASRDEISTADTVGKADDVADDADKASEVTEAPRLSKRARTIEPATAAVTTRTPKATAAAAAAGTDAVLIAAATSTKVTIGSIYVDSMYSMGVRSPQMGTDFLDIQVSAAKAEKWLIKRARIYRDVVIPGPTPPPTPPTTPPTTPANPVPTGVAGAWTLKFQDEFSGTALDLTKWSNCWFSPTCGTMNNVSTSPSNVGVVGGNLVLTLSNSNTGALVSTNPHYGGASTGYTFTTGVVEARIWFPGNGTDVYNWPAFWSSGQVWPGNGENDIAEVLGGDMTVNYHSGSGAHNQGAVAGYWGGGFHTYTLVRKANSSDVYYDGVLVESYATDDGASPHYLIIGVGQGGTSSYGAASQVKVDYVRAWK